VFWDVFGKRGFPIRATVSDLGPLLLGRLFGLNATQQGVLALVFKIADDNGLLLLDVKDLRAMLQFAGDNASQFNTEYGHISAASVGAIQRAVLEIEQQGGASFFGEPMLDVDDLIQRRAAAVSSASSRRQAHEFAQAFSRFCGCWPNSSSICPKSAIPKTQTRVLSTKPICCSTMRTGAARQDRAGGALSLKRRRLFRHQLSACPKPCSAARQPGPARIARSRAIESGRRPRKRARESRDRHRHHDCGPGEARSSSMKRAGPHRRNARSYCRHLARRSAMPTRSNHQIIGHLWPHERRRSRICLRKAQSRVA
jgi:hypothetical protein